MTTQSTPSSWAPRGVAAARPPAASPPRRLLLGDGTLVAGATAGGDVASLHRAMVRLRRADEALARLSADGGVGHHVGCGGDEAFVVGSASATRANDWVFPCPRSFGAALCRGLPLTRYVDGLFGNARDPSKGRQVPPQLGSRAIRVAPVSGSLGAQLSHAVGLSWAAKARGDDAVALVYFSEDAVGAADFHAAMNFAGVFRTPTVFACRGARAGSAVDRGAAYGIPAVRVDGQDLLAVLAVTREAIARAASGDGPTLIEAEWGERVDPIARVVRFLERAGSLSPVDEKALAQEIDTEIEQAIAAARALPAPPPTSLFDDVYDELPWHLREQRRELDRSR